MVGARSVEPRRLTLRDGTRVHIRPIRPDDAGLLRAGFERLSPESRYRRFFTVWRTLSDAQLAFLTQVDSVDHFAWIAFAPGEGDGPGDEGHGVAVARYVRQADDPEAAEAAVAVADDYQGRGLGTMLLDALAEVAAGNGIRRFVSYVLHDNTPMLDIFRRAGATIVRDEPGVVRVEVELPRPPDTVRDATIGRVLREAATGEHPVLLGPRPDGGRRPPVAGPGEAPDAP